MIFTRYAFLGLHLKMASKQKVEMIIKKKRTKQCRNIEIWDIKIKSVSAPNTDSNVIRDLCIDSRHGQRLAVIFEDSAFIGIYNVQISPLNLREKNIFTSM